VHACKSEVFLWYKESETVVVFFFCCFFVFPSPFGGRGVVEGREVGVGEKG
jgi:hypothetical protein